MRIGVCYDGVIPESGVDARAPTCIFYCTLPVTQGNPRDSSLYTDSAPFRVTVFFMLSCLSLARGLDLLLSVVLNNLLYCLCYFINVCSIFIKELFFLVCFLFVVVYVITSPAISKLL